MDNTVIHKVQKIISFLVADLLLAGVSLCVFSYFHHVKPRALPPDTFETGIITETVETTDTAEAEPEIKSLLKGYDDKFTDGDIVKDTSHYSSANVSIDVSTNVIKAESGDEVITYYVQDIYIKDITSFKTALADDTFGQSIVQNPLTMSISNNALCSINGDYYGSHSERGVVIRNGTLYRINPFNDVCVLYYDGTMRLFSEDDFKAKTNEYIQDAYQAWCFGPSLVVDGQAITEFDSDISGKNPRSAIGYYEPGHYCFVTIDGRQTGYSNGMTFDEMAQLFVELGCVNAYNLDGGKSAMMTFDEKIINRPYNDGRESSDIVYICELETSTEGE